MAYQLIHVPGTRSSYFEFLSIRILGSVDDPVVIVITFTAAGAPPHPPSVTGEVTFSDVLEYRWVDQDVSYGDIPYHTGDFKFGLIEIIDSKYIENMAAKSPRRDSPGERLGPGIKESEVKHFRLGFDDYGRFDVIAFDVSVRQI